MKHLLKLLFFLAYSQIVLQAQTKVPAMSPCEKSVHDFSISHIEINYCRPQMRDRKIFGDLVPYGELWRTGATESTTISFGQAVKINNVILTEGKYGFFIIPEQNGNWQILLSKNPELWQKEKIEPSDVSVRVSVKPTSVSPKIETFFIRIGDATESSAKIIAGWEDKMVSVTVEPAEQDIAMKNIEKIATSTLSYENYIWAAEYLYFNNYPDLDKIIRLFDKGLEFDPEAFWADQIKAYIFAKQGKHKEAVSSLKIAIEKAEKVPEYLVYARKMKKDLIKMQHNQKKTI